MLKTKMRHTLRLLFLTIALAFLSGCSDSELKDAAKDIGKSELVVEETPESPPVKTTASVRFKVHEKDGDLEYRIDDVVYAAANLSAPKELELGKHRLAARRQGTLLFEIPFAVEASDEVMVVDVMSPKRAAAIAIIKAGGRVVFQGPPGDVDAVDDLPEEHCDFFGVVFFGKQFDDSVFEVLNQVDLSSIDASYSNLTDKGLQLLGDYSQLNGLGINGTKVTAKSLKRIAKASPPLSRVLVDGIDLPEDFLAYLSNCKMDIFSASDTNFSDEHVNSIKGNTYWLCALKGTKITDEGLQKLAGTKFRTLILSNTSISDVGIEHCLEFEKLEEINLEKTQVTEAGLEMLRRKFPDIKIKH